MLDDRGSIVEIAGAGGLPARLSTTALPAETIGGTTYQARLAIVQSRHVTYQQKTHVWGFIEPTRGGTWNGYGGVYGGGGQVSSRSESVVQVVYTDFDGADATAELPASTSVREGAILRLDFMNGDIFAAQNISGKQEIRGLLGPGDYIPMPRWSGLLTVLCVATFLSFGFHSWVATLLLAAGPAIRLYQRYQAKQQRKALGEYMAAALTTAPA